MHGVFGEALLLKDTLLVRGLMRLQEHGGEQATHAVQGEEAAHAEEWGTEAMIHHIVDSTNLDFGFFAIDLSPLQIPPVHVGGLEIDFSITKHVVFLFLAALLTIVTMWFAARAAQRLEQGEKAPGGLLNAMEAFYLYLRDDVALANIGRGGERFVPLVIALFFFILYANLLGRRVGTSELQAGLLVDGDQSLPVADALATVDDAGRLWSIALVNRHPSKPLDCVVTFKGTPLSGTFQATVLAGDSPDAYNDVDSPNRVAPLQQALEFQEGSTKLPPHSLTVLQVPMS